MEETFYCAYCGKNKPNSEQTDEHVIPRKIGGAVAPTNPFILRTVCYQCNKICGLFVDAPFTKNYLIHSLSTQANRGFVSVDKNAIFPLSFLGNLDWPDIVPQELKCEVWLGPTGDQIFHFHKPYPEISGTLGMIEPATLRDIDPGYVVTFIRATNPVWHPAIYRSVTDHFEKETRLYFGNSNPIGRFIEADPQVNLLITKLRERLKKENGTLKIAVSLDMGFAERFQAKMALGMGTLFFSNEYSSSHYATFLRNYMWTKDTKAREGIPLKGKGLFQSSKFPILDMAGHEGAIVVLLLPNSEGIGLYCNLFKRQDFLVLASDTLDHWPSSHGEGGIAFAIAPAIGKSIGPIPSIEFIASMRRHIEHSVVQDFFDEIENTKKQHPSFDRDQ